MLRFLPVVNFEEVNHGNSRPTDISGSFFSEDDCDVTSCAVRVMEVTCSSASLRGILYEIKIQGDVFRMRNRACVRG